MGTIIFPYKHPAWRSGHVKLPLEAQTALRNVITQYGQLLWQWHSDGGAFGYYLTLNLFAKVIVITNPNCNLPDWPYFGYRLWFQLHITKYLCLLRNNTQGLCYHMCKRSFVPPRCTYHLFSVCNCSMQAEVTLASPTHAACSKEPLLTSWKNLQNGSM